MNISKIFPALVAQDARGHCHSGYLDISCELFFVKFLTPHGIDDMTDITMECDNKMASLLGSKKDLIQQRLKQSDNLLEFLVELKVIMENELKNLPKSQRSAVTNFHCRLMDQITKIGWDKVSLISSDLHEIELQTQDVKGRCHSIQFLLPDHFPNVEPKCQTTLPQEFILDWSKSSTLESACIQFQNTLELYQDFWSVMDEIDGNTWVLEPEHPTRADTRRRIAVASSASILLVVNPKQPYSMPEFTFLGPDKVTEPLKAKLMSNDMDVWNTTLSLLDNIRRFFDIDLPKPSDTKEEEYRVECGICYSHLLEEASPDTSCESANCAQVFHRACIYEWLRALPDSRQSFSIIFGECPYCSKQISARMPANV